MSLRDLAYRIAHNHPGAVPALAVRLGKNSQSLQNQLNPNYSAHQLNLNDFEQIVDFTDANHDVARYFADKSGHLLIKIIQFDGSDTCLLDGYMEIIKELGELSQEFQKSYADGRITNKELMQIKAQATDVMTKIAAFVHRVEQIAE